MNQREQALRVTDLDADAAMFEFDPASSGDAAPAEDPHARWRGRGSVAALAPSHDAVRSGPQRLEVVVDGWRFRFAVEPRTRARLRDAATQAAGVAGPAIPQTIRAQIPGRVVTVAVAPGDRVEQGQRLLSIEAMKMENEVRAGRAGTVEAVGVTAGGTVELGDELVRIA